MVLDCSEIEAEFAIYADNVLHSSLQADVCPLCRKRPIQIDYHGHIIVVCCSHLYTLSIFWQFSWNFEKYSICNITAKTISTIFLLIWNFEDNCNYDITANTIGTIFVLVWNFENNCNYDILQGQLCTECGLTVCHLCGGVGAEGQPNVSTYYHIFFSYILFYFNSQLLCGAERLVKHKLDCYFIQIQGCSKCNYRQKLCFLSNIIHWALYNSHLYQCVNLISLYLYCVRHVYCIAARNGDLWHHGMLSTLHVSAFTSLSHCIDAFRPS